MPHREDETWVAMNDGVRLDVSVCVPEGASPPDGWPGVLLIHGHGEANSKASMLGRARQLAGQGYVGVAYSVRGQGCSEGLSFQLGPRELFDLQDVIDWALRELPVHRDRLAVAGSSQGGWHAYMAAAHHPAVAAVVAESIFTDGAEFAVTNGCLATWFFTRTMRRRVMTAGLPEVMRRWALDGNWHLIQEWMRVRSPLIFAGRIRCPVLIVHGWHDAGMSPNQAITMFERLPVPKKLYLGGGGHDAQDAPEAQAQRERLIDRWLDHWLKGEDTGLLAEPPVLYTRRPGWEHVAAESFPPGDVATRTLYLRAGGALSPEPPAGPAAHANVNNVPRRPDYTLRDAIHDDLAGVPDALVREVAAFESEPLPEPLEIAGAPRFRFWMLSNHPCFQVHAELFDVNREGAATLISRGHHGTRAAEPGRHVTVEIEGRAIGYRVPAGHRLRLAVSNYDTRVCFPYFEPFRARLYHDRAHPSAMQLPVRGR